MYTPRAHISELVEERELIKGFAPNEKNGATLEVAS